MVRRLLPLLLPLSFAACGDGGSGTPVSIDVKSEDGDNASFRMENGAVALKGEGFQGNFKMPAFKMTAENFDMDGVKLYPKSEITNFHIAAIDKAGKGEDEGKVTVAFTSPAALVPVQGWFRERLAAKGFKFNDKGNGFAGTTEDGDPFKLDLSADGGAKTRGRIEISGS